MLPVTSVDSIFVHTSLDALHVCRLRIAPSLSAAWRSKRSGRVAGPAPVDNAGRHAVRAAGAAQEGGQSAERAGQVHEGARGHQSAGGRREGGLQLHDAAATEARRVA